MLEVPQISPKSKKDQKKKKQTDIDQVHRDIKNFEKKQNRSRREVTKLNVKYVKSIPGQNGFDIMYNKKTPSASPISNFYCKGYADEQKFPVVGEFKYDKYYRVLNKLVTQEDEKRSEVGIKSEWS